MNNCMTDPYLISSNVVYRLEQEYLKHKNLVIGFDFDNTIFDFHGVGHEYPELIYLLQECSDLGFTMCVYTGNIDIDKVLNLCKDNSIRVDFINESPIKAVSVPHKPYFSILLDDRAGLASAFVDLSVVIARIKIQKGIYE